MSGDPESVANLIRDAFDGVVLGGGVSLRRAEVADSFEQIEIDESDPEGNVVDDWTRIPLRELDRDCISHLDAEGFRYYLPAMLLALLDDYAPGSMRTIGTVSALNPGLADSESHSYHMYRYSLLTEKQKAAVAEFIATTTEWFGYEDDDLKILVRGFGSYWKHFRAYESDT